MTPLDAIRDTVCEVFGCTAEELRSAKKITHIARARQAFVWLCRDLNGDLYSYPYLGRYLHHKDHSSAMNAKQRAEQLLAHGGSFESLVNECRAKLKRGSIKPPVKLRIVGGEEASGQ